MKRGQRQSGFSLVELLVMSTLVAVAMLISIAAFNGSQRTALKGQEIGELDDLRRYLLGRLSCRETLHPPGGPVTTFFCPTAPGAATAIVAGRAIDGTVLIDTNGAIAFAPQRSFTERHQLRVRCVKNTAEIFVEVRSKDPDGQWRQGFHNLFWVPFECPN